MKTVYLVICPRIHSHEKFRWVTEAVIHEGPRALALFKKWKAAGVVCRLKLIFRDKVNT